jgi:transcriptional regulator with XRE-family HTH domain
VLEDVSHNLRRLRRDRDLSQTQVARLVGIRQQELSAIERGLQPKLALVERMARVLCVHPNELLRSPSDVRGAHHAAHEQIARGSAADLESVAQVAAGVLS